MSKGYDDLLTQISETEVEKWTRTVDAERKRILYQSL